MNEIPNIKMPKMRMSSEDWCKHYAGFFEHGIGNGIKTHCHAGVEYASVEKQVEYTVQRAHEKTPYPHHKAHPCFKHQAHLTDGCAKCQYLTPEEIEAKHKESTAFVNRITLAREAILDELRRRWKERVTPEHGITAPRDISLFSKPQKHYFCGAGKMECPICHVGTLQYSRASYNGHVHARCSTAGCVAWME